MTGSQISADQWIADAESGCLLRRDRPQSSPFRTVVRTRVPVDRHHEPVRRWAYRGLH